MNYEHEALILAERYGITNYQVKNNIMVFYTTYTMERCIYQCIIDLDTKAEIMTIATTL